MSRWNASIRKGDPYIIDRHFPVDQSGEIVDLDLLGNSLIQKSSVLEQEHTTLWCDGPKSCQSAWDAADFTPVDASGSHNVSEFLFCAFSDV